LVKKRAVPYNARSRFSFLSSSHKEALASIVYGIQKRKGFIAIVGGVGVGKTTLIRSYLRGRQKNLKIVYLFMQISPSRISWSYF